MRPIPEQGAYVEIQRNDSSFPSEALWSPLLYKAYPFLAQHAAVGDVIGHYLFYNILKCFSFFYVTNSKFHINEIKLKAFIITGVTQNINTVSIVQIVWVKMDIIMVLNYSIYGT